MGATKVTKFYQISHKDYVRLKPLFLAKFVTKFGQKQIKRTTKVTKFYWISCIGHARLVSNYF